MCVEYWSTDKVRQHGDLFVELSHEKAYSNYTMREFSLTNTKVGLRLSLSNIPTYDRPNDCFAQLICPPFHPSTLPLTLPPTLPPSRQINESRVLKHFQYTEWPEDEIPTNSTAIIDLIGVLQKAQHQNGGGPIVLHDRYIQVYRSPLLSGSHGYLEELSPLQN